jgi:hypothetical protein
MPLKNSAAFKFTFLFKINGVKALFIEYTDTQDIFLPLDSKQH